MASKSIHLSCKTIYFLSFILLLIIGSCTATRPGSTMFVEDKQKQPLDSENTKTHRRRFETGFRFQGQMFNFFPKGTPIPPSGPSKRHNSVVDSTPSD
ncbi:hypothetical protein Ddye_030681 [Dipteronia dyeriana]|uniref:Uncharacterized protein n=1 Tax=Dipteronia dyeriana TaxID=168575 RepID=A0AAD9TGU8_9ROSI|nr:hypothetical protein Ddye_030681 [Dipteronia dyeriana]